MVEFNDLWPIFLWIFLGLIIFYIFPIILMISVLSICAIVIFIYGLLKGIHREPYSSPKWDRARRIICRIFEIYGKIWYGYEIDEMNFDQIPSSAEGPALFIAYHGRPSFDIPFFIAQVFLRKKRLIHCVALRDNFKFPGLSHVVWAMGAFPGTTREECISKLKEGKLVLIAPGGMPECLKSSPKTYNFVWGNRLGFAKVALESKAPVITMFTENCRPPGFFAGFPVKLITHLGSPMKFNEDETPENVKELCMVSLSNLIQKHQQLPCTIFKAMRQRILTKKEYEEIRDH